MNRPLVICDCDEVILHMVRHFRDWLGESQGVAFEMGSVNFAKAMRWQQSGEIVPEEEIWRLLGSFFDTEMDRQLPIAGALEGLAQLQTRADLVILTNLGDAWREARARQLENHGLAARVFTNQGPKGPAIRAILDEYRPSRAIFIDDLPQHHQSAADSVPEVARLHFCGEPLLAPHIDCAHRAGHADARIDDWAAALPWLIQRIEEQGT